MARFSENETRIIGELAEINDVSEAATYMRNYGSFMDTEGSQTFVGFLARLNAESQAPPDSSQLEPQAFQAYRAAMSGLARVQLEGARHGQLGDTRELLSAVSRMDGAASDLKADIVGKVGDNIAKLARSADSSAPASAAVAELAAHAGNILATDPVAIINELRESNVDVLDHVLGELVARGGVERIEGVLAELGQELHAAIASNDPDTIRAAAGATGFLLSEANQAITAYVQNQERQAQRAFETDAAVIGLLVGALVGGLIGALPSAATATAVLESIVGNAGTGKDVGELLGMVREQLSGEKLPSFGTIQQVVDAVALEHRSDVAKDAFDAGLKAGRADSALSEPAPQASLVDDAPLVELATAVDLSGSDVLLGEPVEGAVAAGSAEVAALAPDLAGVLMPDSAGHDQLAAVPPGLEHGFDPGPTATGPEDPTDLAGATPPDLAPVDLTPPELGGTVDSLAPFGPDGAQASSGSLAGVQFAQQGPPLQGVGPDGFGGVPDPLFGVTGGAGPDVGGITADQAALDLPDAPPPGPHGVG